MTDSVTVWHSCSLAVWQCDSETVLQCSVAGCTCDNVAVTILWPQQTVRSSCLSSKFNGIGPHPLINGLIQHTFKINFLFVEKFPVIL